MAASRSLTAMATWSISVSSTARTYPAVGLQLSLGVALEQRDAILADALALLGVGHTPAGLRGQAQHGQLALGLVAVHRSGGLAHQLERVDGRHHRLDRATVDEPVHVPGLLVVGEVARHDALELHPQ